MHSTVSDLYYELQGIYFDEYNYLLDAKRKEMDVKYDPVDSMLDTYDYANWLEKEESDDTTLKDNEEEKFADMPTMLQLEGDDKVKGEKALKILTPNKLLNRLQYY